MFFINLTVNLFSLGGIKVIGPSATLIQAGRGEDATPQQKLVVPWHSLQDQPDLFAVLSWHSRVSDFGGRTAEIEALWAWATTDASVSVKFVTGEGGVGKSRLAAEFAEELAGKGWAAGFADLRARRSYAFGKNGTLIVLDYPELNRAEVAELFRDLAAQGQMPRFRVLLLTRRVLADWMDTIHDTGVSGLVDMAPINLGSAPLDGRAAHILFTTAQRRGTEVLETEHAPLGLSEEALEDWLKQAPENQRALFMLAAAVHSVLHPDEEVVRFSGAEIIVTLVERELSRLRRAAEAVGFAEPYALPRLLAMATLAGGVPTRQIVDWASDKSLQLGLPVTEDLEARLTQVGLLSEDGVPPPTPDILAAAFAVTVLAKKPETAPELIWAAVGGDPKRGLARLAQVTYDAEVVLGMHEHRLCRWFAEALRGRSERCSPLERFVADPELPLGFVEVGVVVWETLYRATDDNAEKARLANNLGLALMQAGDNGRALAILEESVTLRQRLVSLDRGRFGPDLAVSFVNLGTVLSKNGDHARALAAIEDAVAIFRQFVEVDPEHYEAALADSLYASCGPLINAGRRSEALSAVEEAVSIFRRLAVAEPRFKPRLAECLNNLRAALNEVGDVSGAFTAAEESVEIFRRLATAEPASYQMELAKSLIRLSDERASSRDTSGALAAIKEAVSIYRRSAEVYPAFWESDLAESLGHLVMAHTIVGETAEALAAAEEAYAIYRRRAAAYPDHEEPNLAENLRHLSLARANAGDRTGALAAAEESVAILGRLVAANPEQYEPHLAASLNHLYYERKASRDTAAPLVAIEEAARIYRRLAAIDAVRYEPMLVACLGKIIAARSSVGDSAGALVAAEESVAIYRRLAAVEPALYEPDLAESLMHLSDERIALGDGGAARALIEEAVGIYRRLAAADPAHSESDLAGSLNNLCIARSTAGDSAGALAAAEESVAIFRRLAAADPTRSESDLAGSLNNLCTARSTAGDSAGALVAAEEGVAIFRRLAAVEPELYEPDLAESLMCLSNERNALGDGGAVLAAVQEAVGIFRRLATSKPGRNEPKLAACLSALTVALSKAGDAAGALASAKEGVAIRRRLAAADPVGEEPNLAGILNNLCLALGNMGDSAGALAAAEESVAIYRRLVAANPANHEADLANSLSNLALFLDAAMDSEGALAASREAVATYRRVAAANPALHEPALARSLHNACNVLMNAGNHAEALKAIAEAVAIRERLATADPARYEADLARSIGVHVAVLQRLSQVVRGVRVSDKPAFREFIEDENYLRSGVLDVWDRFDPDLDDACWQGVLIFDAMNDEVSKDSTPHEIPAKLSAFARDRGLSEAELQEALRRVPIPADLKVADELVESLAAVFSSEFLLLMAQRHYRWAMIELTSLRVTPAFGYLRLEAEGVGLVRLLRRIPHLSKGWFSLDARAAKRFYQVTQGKLKTILEGLPELNAAYELGSAEALHPRLSSAARSLMFVGTTTSGRPLTVLSGHEANLADLRDYFDDVLQVLECQPAVWEGLVGGFRELDLSAIAPMIGDFRARVGRLRERHRAMDRPIAFAATFPQFTLGGKPIWERLVGDTATVEYLFGRPPRTG